MTAITKPAGVGKWEVVRRLRYGALLKLFRHRYGHQFPDDDAGRDDLFVLLCVVSLAPSATDKKIAHTIEMWAPWMSAWEAAEYVEHIGRLNIYERMPAAKVLGKRLNLTNAERERLRLWPIAPIDMTVEQLMEQRKLKRRDQEKQRRRNKGVQPRGSYLANAKPWEAEGIPRSTWYRKRRNETGLLRGKTSPLPTIVGKAATDLSHAVQAESQKGLQRSGEAKRSYRGNEGKRGGQAETKRIASCRHRLVSRSSRNCSRQLGSEPRTKAFKKFDRRREKAVCSI